MGAVSTSTTTSVSPRPRTTDHVGAVRVGAAARHLHPQLVVVSGVDRRAVVRVRPGRHPLPRTAGLLADLTGLSRGNLRARRGPFGRPAGCCDRERTPPGPPRRSSAATSSRRRAALLATPDLPRLTPTHDDRPARAAAPRRGDTMTH